MAIAPVQKVGIEVLSVSRKRQMLEIAESYYRDAQSGLDEELRWGNVVYFVETAEDTMGCFLIVNFDHHATAMRDQDYRFTYLGLGCAKRCSMIPVFQRVKSDFAANME